jgi:hypothetical protein
MSRPLTSGSNPHEISQYLYCDFNETLEANKTVLIRIKSTTKRLRYLYRRKTNTEADFGSTYPLLTLTAVERLLCRQGRPFSLHDLLAIVLSKPPLLYILRYILPRLLCLFQLLSLLSKDCVEALTSLPCC